MTDTSPLRIAVVGAGRIAQHHLRVLSALPDVEVVAICSRSGAKRNETAATFRIPAQYADAETMCREQRPHAVYVLVSAENMFDVGRACLEFRIPLLLEKPPAFTCEQARELCRCAGVLAPNIMVGLNRRFYSTVSSALKTVLHSGPLTGFAIDAPEDIAAKRSSGKFSEAELANWFMLNGIHMVDMIRFFACDVTEVHALRTVDPQAGQHGYTALVRGANGAIGSYRSYWESPGKWRIDLYGTGVRAILEPIEAGRIIYSDGREESIAPAEADTDFKPGFFAQSRYFIDCVRRAQPVTTPGCSLPEAVKSMELGEIICGA